MRSQIGNDPRQPLAGLGGMPESGHMTDTDQADILHVTAREACDTATQAWCGTCYAWIGDPCVTRSGHATRPHVSRVSIRRLDIIQERAAAEIERLAAAGGW